VIAELRVRDLVTIADVTLPLGPGLNVLTGETGAGKSMVVDALGLLLGGRADTTAIRPGAARAIVEAVFEPVPRELQRELEALGLDPADDRLVVRRDVSSEGRSRAWVNGSPTTIAALERLGGWLADLHGQQQTVSLLRPETQRLLLDGFAGATGEAEAVAAGHAALADLTRREAELIDRRESARRRADYLRHVVQEIDAARLEAGEAERLDQEITRLSHAEDIRSLGGRIDAAVDGEEGSALASLGEADRALRQLERLDPAVAEWRALLDAAYAALDDLARQARAYAEGIDDDPERLARLESRRSLLDRLRQKYGETLEAVLRARAEAGTELDLLDTADLDLKALAAERRAAEQALAGAAAALTERRRAGAERLARAVNRLLPRLGLTGGRLDLRLDPVAPIASWGAETVQFTVQLNVGLDARPLHKAASGGELSRLMLALTVALARRDGSPTLVFDEIDQGIGGEVGGQVGEALAQVAARHQVLVITHLPTIAARADRHLMVAKRTKGGLATSDVHLLHGEDRVVELARMLGDPESGAARRHALALLGQAASR
jgi:DNA repair protein RecN (Recombination protein N)